MGKGRRSKRIPEVFGEKFQALYPTSGSSNVAYSISESAGISHRLSGIWESLIFPYLPLSRPSQGTIPWLPLCIALPPVSALAGRLIEEPSERAALNVHGRSPRDVRFSDDEPGLQISLTLPRESHLQAPFAEVIEDDAAIPMTST